MALLAFSALAIDISYLRVIDLQLDQAIDAAVLAGSGYLDGTLDGIDDARDAAVTTGNSNEVLGGTSLFTNDDVIFGSVSMSEGVYTFEEMDPDSNDVDIGDINAIRIELEHSSIAALLSSAAFENDTLSSSGSGTAVRPFNWGATAVDCFLPVALPDCNFDPDATTNGPAMFVSGASTLGDNVGWAGVGGVNGKNVRQQLQGTCAGGTIAVDEYMDLQNGMIAKALDEMGDYLADGTGSTEPWDPTYFPQPSQGDALTVTGDYPASPSLVNEDGDAMVNIIAGPISIIDMAGEPGAGCGSDGGDWQQDQPIVGFTYGFIYDVVKDGNFMGMHVQMDFVNNYDFATEVGPGSLGNVIDADAPPFLIP